MKTLFRHRRTICAVILALMLMFVLAMPALAAEPEAAAQQAADNSISMKAVAAGIAVGIAAAAGAVSMGWATSKAADSISRQPEADGKIRTALMLGLVFIETAIIYALLVVILIIFVL